MPLNTLSNTEFSVDIIPGGAPAIVHSSQGDIGRQFTVNLTRNGRGMDVSNYDIKLRGIKPDKTVFEYTLDANSYGQAVFSTTEQMTIVPGPVECELVFSESGKKVASANFVLKVEGAPYDENAASESIIESAEDIVHDWLDTNGVTLTLDTNGIVRLTT